MSLCSSVRIMSPKETCPYVLLSKSSSHKNMFFFPNRIPYGNKNIGHSFSLSFIKSMSGSFPKSLLYSLSKLGVKIPFPIASWISVVLQKRPPSVSRTGMYVPVVGATVGEDQFTFAVGFKYIVGETFGSEAGEAEFFFRFAAQGHLHAFRPSPRVLLRPCPISPVGCLSIADAFAGKVRPGC